MQCILYALCYSYRSMLWHEMLMLVILLALKSKKDVTEYRPNTSATNDLNKFYLLQFFNDRKTEVRK